MEAIDYIIKVTNIPLSSKTISVTTTQNMDAFNAVHMYRTTVEIFPEDKDPFLAEYQYRSDYDDAVKDHEELVEKANKGEYNNDQE